MLFQENIVTVYAIFMALLCWPTSSIFSSASVYIRVASKVVLIPKGYIFPAVLAFCFFGAYGFNQKPFRRMDHSSSSAYWATCLRRNGFPCGPDADRLHA